MYRREIDRQLSNTRYCGEAVRTEHHLFDRSGIGHAYEDDAGGVGDLARARRQPRAGIYQGFGLARGAIPDRDLMARLDQSPAHRKSHHAESEIAEFFGFP